MTPPIANKIIDPIAVQLCAAALQGILANPNVTRATLTDEGGQKSLALIAAEITDFTMQHLKKGFTISA